MDAYCTKVLKYYINCPLYSMKYVDVLEMLMLRRLVKRAVISSALAVGGSTAVILYNVGTSHMGLCYQVGI